MARNAEVLIREAAAVLSEAMDEAAAIALLAVERYGAQLQTFCKQVAEEAGIPEAWNALRKRAHRLQKARSEALEARPPRNRPVEELKRGLRQAPASEKAAAVVEALERDPDVFGDPAVLEAAALAVSSSLGAPPARSEGTRSAEKRTEQVAFLAYLTSASANLTKAEEVSEPITEQQAQAARQVLDNIVEKAARLGHRVGYYDLTGERS